MVSLGSQHGGESLSIGKTPNVSVFAVKSPRRGENDAIVTEAEPRLLLRHSRPSHAGSTAKTLAFGVLVIKKMD